ncbi:hypothetical protein Tco_0691028 [Tanacetum coccineum]
MLALLSDAPMCVAAINQLSKQSRFEALAIKKQNKEQRCEWRWNFSIDDVGGCFPVEYEESGDKYVRQIPDDSKSMLGISFVVKSSSFHPWPCMFKRAELQERSARFDKVIVGNPMLVKSIRDHHVLLMWKSRASRSDFGDD